MTTQTVKILNKVGLHARPASMLVNTAGKFGCDIKIKSSEKSVTAKSMINLLSLRAKMGDTITIEADGADEKEAVKALTDLINSKFGED